jgi:hypothetical protein
VSALCTDALYPSDGFPIPRFRCAIAARQTTAQRSVEEEEDDAPPSARFGQGRGEESEDEEEDDEDEELLRELEGGAGELMELQRAEMMRRALEYDELRRLGIGFHVGESLRFQRGEKQRGGKRGRGRKVRGGGKGW